MAIKRILYAKTKLKVRPKPIIHVDTARPGSERQSFYGLRDSGLGFQVPDGAMIDSIRVEITGSSGDDGANVSIRPFVFDNNPSRGMAYETTLNDSRTDDWLTPEYIIRALGRFDLDPCCPENMPWRTARLMYTPRNDGLVADWGSRRVWLNPPYGRATGNWLRKLRDHHNGIALVFARTETRMFFESVWNHATGILFISGRLRFCRVDGTQTAAATAPSCLIAYGHGNAEILRQAAARNLIVGKYIALMRE